MLRSGMMNESFLLGGTPVAGFALGDGEAQSNRLPRALKYATVGGAGVGAVAAGISYATKGKADSRYVLLGALFGAVGGGCLGWASF